MQVFVERALLCLATSMGGGRQISDASTVCFRCNEEFMPLTMSCVTRVFLCKPCVTLQCYIYTESDILRICKVKPLTKYIHTYIELALEHVDAVHEIMCWCEPQHVAGQIMRFGPPPRVDERLTEVIRRPDPAIKAYSEILVDSCLRVHSSNFLPIDKLYLKNSCLTFS